jgi:hypothetical protein
MRAIGRVRRWTGHRTPFPRSEEVISDAMGIPQKGDRQRSILKQPQPTSVRRHAS